MYIAGIDSCIDFLPNLRQTQNTVEQMKKNRFVFNETVAKKNSRTEREKTTLVECLAMIMVVTFLIEFRLPNFSPTVSRTRLESFSVNEK